MRPNSFDAKFGDDFISALPVTPGVYQVFNDQNILVYVGKAKNLRRRISQYRNAKRRKIHRKMKSIVKAAARIDILHCDSDAEALRLELKLIQTHRPVLNIANAFDFMYPMIGLKLENKNLSLVLTSSPESFGNFSFHGCFRSLSTTRQAFYALSRVLYFFGQLKRNRSKAVPYSTRFELAELDPVWLPRLESFLLGTSKALLADFCLAMLDKSGAMQRRSQAQEDIEVLEKFWKHEITKLLKLRQSAKFMSYPVPQSQRDLLLLNLRLEKTNSELI